MIDSKEKPARAAAQRPASQSPRSSWGRRSPLKLVAALRGTGVLSFGEETIAVSYELDVFTAGALCTAAGSVDGDLSALTAAEVEGGPGRLRLENGDDLAVELNGVDADFANVEASLTAAQAAAFADSKPAR